MSAEHGDEHDGVLTGALADLIAQLRSCPYQAVIEGVEKSCRGAADDFIAKLASHLRREEEVLFPAILRADPAASAEIEVLLEEHRQLRGYAVELATQIRERDTPEACTIARSFLAALFEHIDRERRTVDSRFGHVGATADSSR